MRSEVRRRPLNLRPLGRVALYVLGLLLVAVMLGPLLWMFSTSLKTSNEALAIPARLIPSAPQWANYTAVFTRVAFGRYLFNSFFVATTVTLVALLFHSMAGYSLARLRYKGRGVIFLAILSTMMVPFTAIVIPLFILIRALGWIDSYQAMIVPAIPHAFGIFLLRQFYVSIPRELEEAALIDGSGLVGVYWHVMLPLSRPILAALGIFFFLANWNSFFWPLVVVQSPDLWTVQLGIQHFTGEHSTDWNLVMAASTVAALPTLILFLVLQRRLVEGIKLTGMK
jgi:multiple sugar transport system permease protein